MILSILSNKVGKKRIKIQDANTQTKTCIEFNAYLIKCLSTSNANLKEKIYHYKHIFLYYKFSFHTEQNTTAHLESHKFIRINTNSNCNSAGIKSNLVSNMLLHATKVFAETLISRSISIILLLCILFQSTTNNDAKVNLECPQDFKGLFFPSGKKIQNS